MRLADLALKYWRYVDGYAAAHGQTSRLADLDLDRFCSLVWWWATRNAEKDSDIRKFESRIWRPPEGEVAAGPWSPEAEQSAFAALKQGLGM